jgi:formylglycine-generating enzyme required for sulfatase activity
MVRTFAEAVATSGVLDWALGYAESDCPVSIKESALVLVATYISTEGKETPDELLDEPEVEDITFSVGEEPNWTPIVEETNGVPFVYVPAGCFMMGSADEQVEAAFEGCQAMYGVSCGREFYEAQQPLHEVCLSAFWISQTEVTNDQYRACVDAGVCDPAHNWAFYDPDYADYSVVSVFWSEAEAYAQWIGGSLPTEAQWEYAARGPAGNVYPWGDEFNGFVLNFCDNECPLNNRDANWDDGYSVVAPVGSYPNGASWVGALDMAGNVWEWVADWYSEDYYATLTPGSHDPAGPESGEFRVLRGGSFEDAWWTAHAAYRARGNPIIGSTDHGFRVVVPIFP